MERIFVISFLLAVTIPCCWSNTDFDFIVFAQQWPQSMCIEANVTHEHTCYIAPNVSTWTVHGLWPTKAGTHGPNFCNKTLPYDPERLKPIRPQLLKYWPNIFADQTSDDFWKHEWDKHGTCAQGFPVMNTELKYFKTGLQQRDSKNLQIILAKEGIKPSDTHKYQYTDVVLALKHGLGYKPTIQCFYDKESKTQHFTQLEMCLNKSFDVIECPKKGAEEKNALKGLSVGGELPCRDSIPIAYPVIKHR